MEEFKIANYVGEKPGYEVSWKLSGLVLTVTIKQLNAYSDQLFH